MAAGITHSIIIDRMDNGWLVRAGCLQLVFTNADVLSREIACWLSDHRKVEKAYAERYRPEKMEKVSYRDMMFAPPLSGLGGIMQPQRDTEASE